MRISDWSSDVCSSDLGIFRPAIERAAVKARAHGETRSFARDERRDRQADARLGIEAEADKRTVLKGEEGRRDENLRALTGRRVSPAPFIGVIDDAAAVQHVAVFRSEEHPAELQLLMRLPYAVFCL